jgi:hypothetical protein
MKKDNIIKRIICFGLLAVMAFTFAGCEFPANPNYDSKNPVIETEFFRVQIRRGDGYAVVFELTESGKEQEILAVPDYVEGLPVKQVGWDEGYVQIGIRSDKLKKIYIPHTVEYVTRAVVGGEEETVFIPYGLDYYAYSQKKIVSEEFSNLLIQANCFTENHKAANLTYYYNYEGSPNNNYYWIDYITGSNLYLNPASPIRENHEFAGWYLESECMTEWDGVLPTSENKKLNLYAGWNYI